MVRVAVAAAAAVHGPDVSRKRGILHKVAKVAGGASCSQAQESWLDRNQVLHLHASVDEPA